MFFYNPCVRKWGLLLPPPAGRGTRSARPRGLGGDFEFLPLKSPRNPITPFETSRVATLHPGLYKGLREGGRRVIGCAMRGNSFHRLRAVPLPRGGRSGCAFSNVTHPSFAKKDSFPNTRKRVFLKRRGFAQYAMTMPPSLAYIEESAEVGVRMISPMAGHFSRIMSRT